MTTCEKSFSWEVRERGATLVVKVETWSDPFSAARSHIDLTLTELEEMVKILKSSMLDAAA